MNSNCPRILQICFTSPVTGVTRGQKVTVAIGKVVCLVAAPIFWMNKFPFIASNAMTPSVAVLGLQRRLGSTPCHLFNSSAGR